MCTIKMAMIPFSSTNNAGLHENLKCLRGMMELLKAKADDFHNELQNAEHQPRKKRKSEVALWLKHVSDIEEKVQSIGEVTQVGFFHRGQVSNKLQEMMEDVENLLKQSKFPRGILLDENKPEDLELSTVEMEGSTPSRVQDEVWSCFERGEMRVGIFGIGGVGKTTLAMHINNEILKQKRLFVHVYYVTVSRETSVLKLQSDIAKAVGHSLEYEDEPKRAAELRRELAKREKSLLILDDVWEDITMEEVGVSVEGDGCKLLITTRDRGVCRKMKCCQVQMKPLSADESQDLFKKQHGNFETLPNEVKATAVLVAEECDGLPLGIVTMARSMRGETDVPVWMDALRELRDPCTSSHDMENKVFNILKYSYDRLKKEKHRKCFLYCALYGEDCEIEKEELIRQYIAAGLLDGANNREESIDEGHAILNVLESASLLECCAADKWNKNKRFVKMHDLVRDMAIRIMGSTSTGMVIENKSLKEMLGKEEIYMDLKWVSLFRHNTDHIEGLMPDCPNISVLILRPFFLMTISDSFFVKMISLKVLDLSDTEVEVLPTSVSDLCNLTSLMLRSCGSLRFIPSLAKLTKLRELDLNLCERMRELPDGLEELASLEYLDLSHTNVEELPASISDMCNLDSLLLGCCNSLRFIPSLAKLTKLRSLNLFGCENVETLPEGMEELASLEHLDLQGTKIESLHRGVIIKLLNLERFLGNYIIVIPPEELTGLKHMKNLSGVHFKDVSEFSRCVGFGWFNQLETYHVSVGHSPFSIRWVEIFYEEDDPELIKAICWNGVSRGEECLLLPQNVSRLEFSECSFGGGSLLGHLPLLGDVTTDLDLWCSAHDCECLIPEWWTKPLQCIRRLFVEELDEFCGLIREDVVYPYTSFSGLRELTIKGCPKLKKLWMLNLDLPNLEEISIKECEQMEEIFATERGETVKLPRLRYLELEDLPELRSIWGNCKVFFPELFILRAMCFEKMKKIGLVSHSLLSLVEIYVLDCEEMEEIFATEDETGDDPIHFPKLKEVLLDKVPELRSISRKTIVCNSLQFVSIKSSVSKFQRKMDNCPISVPNPGPFRPLRDFHGPTLFACNMPRGWWESLDWNDPATLSYFNQVYEWNFSERGWWDFTGAFQ